MGAPSKPFARVKASRGFEAQAKSTDRIEQQDADEAREKRPSVPVISDKLAQFMNDPVYVTGFTWPGLYVKDPAGFMRQLYVSQFFPNRNVAVDKFYPHDEVPDWAVAKKREVLTGLGIKYVVLLPTTKLADIQAELGS